MKFKTLIMFTAALMAAVCMLSACGGPNTNPGVIDSQTPEGSFIQLYNTETEFGLITIPRLNPENQSDEIAALNEMFESVRDDLLANIKEYKNENGADSFDSDNPTPLCTCTYSEMNGVLSILVKYGCYFSAPQSQVIAVNVNTETGELIEPKDVVALACYTDSEVESALIDYTERSMFAEWEHNLGYEFASRAEKINGIGDPSFGWFDLFDEIIAAYRSPSQTNEWNDLPIYPAVYLDEFGHLYVGADIPSAVGDQYSSAMVCIGRNYNDTKRLNPNNPYGEPFGRSMMSEEAACEAVAFAMGLDEYSRDYSGAFFHLSVEFMEFVENGDGVDEPCYVIYAYSDEVEQSLLQNWWSVGIFSGYICEMNPDGTWQPYMNGTGVLPESVFTGARTEGAMATIYNGPSSYEIWTANPVCEIDLVELSGEGYWMDAGGVTALLFASQRGVTVTFEQGAMGETRFESQQQLYSLELAEGECVLLHMLRPDGMPSQAITAFTGADNAVYIITYDGSGGDAKVEYIVPDFAN